VKQTFPYIKIRLQVVETREETLTPIEFAISNIANKVRDLQAVVSARPVNIVLLQLQLQVLLSFLFDFIFM
jgi:hypothetical protein